MCRSPQAAHKDVGFWRHWHWRGFLTKIVVLLRFGAFIAAVMTLKMHVLDMFWKSQLNIIGQTHHVHILNFPMLRVLLNGYIRMFFGYDAGATVPYFQHSMSNTYTYPFTKTWVYSLISSLRWSCSKRPGRGSRCFSDSWKEARKQLAVGPK